MLGIDLFGHLGYIFIFLGTLFLARKNKFGWFLRFTGEAIWTAIGFYMGLTSIWGWGIVFMSIDIYAYLKWRKHVRS